MCLIWRKRSRSPRAGKGHGRVGAAVRGSREALDEEGRVDHVVVQVKYLLDIAVAACIYPVPDPRGLVSQDVQRRRRRAVLAQKLGKDIGGNSGVAAAISAAAAAAAATQK